MASTRFWSVVPEPLSRMARLIGLIDILRLSGPLALWERVRVRGRGTRDDAPNITAQERFSKHLRLSHPLTTPLPEGEEVIAEKLDGTSYASSLGRHSSSRFNRGGVAQRQVGVILVLAHVRPAFPASCTGLVFVPAIHHLDTDGRPFRRLLGEAVEARANDVFQVRAVGLKLSAGLIVIDAID